MDWSRDVSVGQAERSISLVVGLSSHFEIVGASFAYGQERSVTVFYVDDPKQTSSALLYAFLINGSQVLLGVGEAFAFRQGRCDVVFIQKTDEFF